MAYVLARFEEDCPLPELSEHSFGFQCHRIGKLDPNRYPRYDVWFDWELPMVPPELVCSMRWTPLPEGDRWCNITKSARAQKIASGDQYSLLTAYM